MNNRILIVDDHPAVRMALRLLLASEGYDVVAETGDGVTALELIELHTPSIVILELGLPVVDGLSVIKTLASQRAPVKIVVFTGSPVDEFMMRCKQSGAHAFVSKSSELSEVVYAVRAIRAQSEYFPDHPCSSYAERITQDQILIGRLSVREFKVMHCLLDGMKNIEVASALSLSPKTVNTYKTRMFGKLNIKKMADLYAMASRNGLI